MSNLATISRPVPENLARRLQSAAADLADTTFDDLGMREIARLTGIPRATLYYHFSGKDDLIGFLLRAMLEDLHEAVATAVALDTDLAGRLRAVVHAQFAHLATNPPMSRLLFMNIGKLERLQLIAAGIEAGFCGPVRGLLAEGVASGELAPHDPEVTATAVYGAVTILGLEALLHRGDIDATALTAATFPLFWSGVAREAAT